MFHVEHLDEIAATLRVLPESPGVYKYFDEKDEIIYVGKAKNLKRRVNSYFNREHESRKTNQLVSKIRRIEYIVVNSEQEAFLLENNLIKEFQPHYNILLKDGKSYPSILITREDYPRIIKTRNIVKHAGQYFGPYSFGNSVDMVLELIHTLYPIRTCNGQMSKQSVDAGRHKVCLKYHLGNCCGICENRVDGEQYRQWIEEAKDIIRGDAERIQREIASQIQEHARRMEYEMAGELKKRYELLNQFCSKTVISNTHVGDLDVIGYDEMGENVYIAMLCVHNGCIVKGKVIEYKRQMEEEEREEILAHGILELQKQLGSTTKDVLVPFLPDGMNETLHFQIANSGDRKKLLELAQKNVNQYKVDRLKQSDKLNPDQRAVRILTELKDILGLEKVPMRIESFDNSNIQGTNAVAGCVVFVKGKPSKNDYKKFEIKTVVGADDYASMREVVRRKYQRAIDEGTPLPDLIVADGGIGQMHAIQEMIDILRLNIPVVGLKKDDKHRTNTIVCDKGEIQLPVTSEVFRLMVAIQDEVHRFAISYHKEKRSKRQVKSQLDDIQGIGEVTKQKILMHFGSLKAAGAAEKAEWIKLLGNKRGSDIYEKIKLEITR